MLHWRGWKRNNVLCEESSRKIFRQDCLAVDLTSSVLWAVQLAKNCSSPVLVLLGRLLTSSRQRKLSSAAWNLLASQKSTSLARIILAASRNFPYIHLKPPRDSVPSIP